MSLRAVLALMLVILAAGTPGAQEQQTLRSVLEKARVPPDGNVLPDLDVPIANFASADDQGLFALAYYERAGDRVGEGLRVIAFDRSKRRWHRRVLGDDEPTGWGSVVEARITPRHILFDTHLTPSAGRVLALSHDLTQMQRALGWTLATLPSGSVVIHKSQVHFAPTHSLQVATFDPSSGRTTDIYPPATLDPIRRAFVARVASVYEALGDDWFRVNNHHGDPEQFDSALAGAVEVDPQIDAVAFKVTFGSGRWPEASPPAVQVLVLCERVGQAASALCHEGTFEELSTRSRAAAPLLGRVR